MFKEIFLFEFKYWFKQPTIYINFLIFFLLGFLTMSISGGLFDSFTATTDNGKILINSPFSIYGMINGICNLGLFIIPSIVGASVYKDYQYNMHSLLYAFPISKFSYLGGRFISSLVIAIIALSSIGVGILLATFMPWMNPSFLGSFRLSAYLQSYFFVIIPNLLFFSALIFSIVTISRSITAGFIVVIVLLFTQGLAAKLTANLDNKFLAALLDPYGNQAIGLQTEYWTVSDQNTRLFSLEGAFLWNRILWTILGLVIFTLTYLKFQFSQFATSLTFRKKEEVSVNVDSRSIQIELPLVHQNFSIKEQFKLLYKLVTIEFFNIIKGVNFIVITVIAIISLFASATQLGKMYDTQTYPLTYMVVGLGSGVFSTFIIILTMLFTGILVNRERKLRINQLIDTTPVPNWILLASKFIAIVGMQMLLLAIIIICGILIQMYKGYYRFELGLYINELFGLKLIDLILFAALAMFVQVLTKNYFVGFFILLVYLILSSFFGRMGIEQDIYKYRSGPGVSYSDMNGYGYNLIPYFIYKFYWGAFAILLAIFSNIFWGRGMDKGIKLRWKEAKSRINKTVKMSLAMAFITFLSLGSFIYYQTNIRNEYKSSKEQELEGIEFEKKYKRYDNIPQPRITDVKLNVDIFPTENSLSIKGYYILKNKSKVPIDSVHINYTASVLTHEFSFNKINKLVAEDKKYGYNIYKLQNSLLPGDSIVLDFKLNYGSKGILKPSSAVNYNGTFFNSGLMPSIGYDASGEITSDEVRKKYSLKPKERMADVNDSVARMNTYISHCADWINFETTISTDEGQIAIAPGYLQKEWIENGRRYFHYKMDSKILNFYAFISAKYEVRKDKWKDINIEIYYHKGHEYNLDRMIQGVKMSLDYYTVNFSPYQHRQVRIIEFPRTGGSFAQSFPNTIPYSEAIGFVAKVDDKNEEDIDYPFYVTAHELAHQWWAHQVIGGNVKGATILSETMSQYSALMVMEKEYGKEKMRKFLKYELDHYLGGRGSEQKKELPIILNEGQQYIHYNKGSVVMYALKDYIGEDSLNAALKKYIHKVAFQEPPFTNSLEFLNYIKSATPDSLQYLIKDMFETITLYDNKVAKASYSKTSEGKYLVNISIKSKKLRADSLGKEQDTESSSVVSIQIGGSDDKTDGSVTKSNNKLSSLPLNDWIDIGVFGEENINGKMKDKELFLAKYKITKPDMDFSIIVDKEPSSVGIDPYNKLIEKNSEDNRKKIETFDKNEKNKLSKPH